MPITHEGAEYFSKAELEDKIKDRVRSTAEAHATLETRWKAAEPELAKVATLTSERDAERTRANRIETRYTAATQFGLTDAETLEALEEAHTKAMGKVPEANRVGFTDYLGQVKTDPTLLPSYLRGVFTTQGAQAPVQGGAQQGEQQQVQQVQAGPVRPAWASPSTGQKRVEPGATPDFAQKVAGAKTLDELAALDRERRAGRQ
jgi:hypothetical protein